MYTSAMLKAEFNDGSGQYMHHFSGNVSEPILPINAKPLNDGDAIVATLLSSFFATSNGRTELDYMMPMRRRTPVPSNPQTVLPADNMGMGVYLSSATNVSHSDSVSLACFDEAILRAMISTPFKDELPDFYARMQTAPIEQLPQLLIEINPENADFTVTIVKNPKLTITRTTANEFNMVLDEYRDAPPFVDAFDLVKERVTRQESSLNTVGYAPAVYTNNGSDGSNDTIVFTGEYAMTVNFPQATTLPPMT